MDLPKLVQLLVIFFGIQALKLTVHANEIENSTSNVSYLTYEHHRLPTSVRPVSYHLKVLTHIENLSDQRFSGDVLITLRILQDTNNVILHAQNLNINTTEISFRRANPEKYIGEENCVKNTSTNERYNYLILELCNVAKKGETYYLYIEFAAPLNDKFAGYYKSSYYDQSKKETRSLSMTHFHPTYARSAFPCFDEPAMKAVFVISLAHHKNYTALSNMPMRVRKPFLSMKDYVWSEFEETFVMSTSLVAYTVNEFTSRQFTNSVNRNVLFRIWARPDAINQTAFASEYAPKVLRFFENQFDVQYPQLKIDQIAVPDFRFPAMENWGLIAYREETLLFKENVSTFNNKKVIAEIVAHEMAHQWFGSLTTLKWWSHFWLNEGFATFLAHLAMDHVYPDWHQTEIGLTQKLMDVFYEDAHVNTHALIQNIRETSQIANIFDTISYEKGAALIHMMQHFLGPEAFRAGVTRFLQSQTFGITDENDLYGPLNEEAHVTGALPEDYNVKTILDSWTHQAGYPIINVVRNYQRGTAKITQSRYRLHEQYMFRSKVGNCWWVPLTYTTKGESDFISTKPRTWLECDADGIPVSKMIFDMPRANEWVIFNIKLTGIYKVNYDDRNWNLLNEALNSDDYDKIDVVNRVQLIYDIFSLAWSHHQSYERAFKLAEYLSREKEYLPWKTALESLQIIDRVMSITSDYQLFQDYMRKILTPMYNHVHGLEDTYIRETVRDTRTQFAVLQKEQICEMSCEFAVGDCVNRSLQYFTEWSKLYNPDKRNLIPTDLRSVVYCHALRYDNGTFWNFLWERFKKLNVDGKGRIILKPLGCTRVPEILRSYLYRIYSNDSIVRVHDTDYAFNAIVKSSEIGFRVAMKYFRENLEYLHKFYAQNLVKFGRLFQSLANNVRSDEDFLDLRRLLRDWADHFIEVKQITSHAIETAEIQSHWKEKNYKDIVEVLQKYATN